MFYVEYHITDKCNLNCNGCYHFCPLVQSNVEHKPLEIIKSDLFLLSRFKNELIRLRLMGGEPTLHPKFKEILIFTRELFPDTELEIVSNGTKPEVLIDNKDILIERNIRVMLSKYPFKDDYEETYNSIVNALGDYCYIEDCGEFCEAPLHKKPIEFRLDTKIHCRMRHHCTQLRDGKLYICPLIAYYDYFDNAFSNNLKGLSLKKEGVDLYTCTTDDIYDYLLIHEPKFCDYCEIPLGNMKPWQHSRRFITEWLNVNL